MAITLDAKTTSNSAAPADPYTFSHTVGTGATVLVLLITWRGGATISGVTYNSVACTNVRTDTGSTSLGNSAIYYLLAPSTGANTVSVDFSIAASLVSITAVSLFGTDTTTAVINAHNGAANDTASPVSIDVTSTVNLCWMMDAIGIRGNPSTITQGAESGRTDWTPDWEYEPGGNAMAGGGTFYSDVSPAGAKTFSWTFTGTGGSVSGVAISPPVPSTTRPYLKPMGIFN